MNAASLVEKRKTEIIAGNHNHHTIRHGVTCDIEPQRYDSVTCGIEPQRYDSVTCGIELVVLSTATMMGVDGLEPPLPLPLGRGISVDVRRKVGCFSGRASRPRSSRKVPPTAGDFMGDIIIPTDTELWRPMLVAGVGVGRTGVRSPPDSRGEGYE